MSFLSAYGVSESFETEIHLPINDADIHHLFQVATLQLERGKSVRESTELESKLTTLTSEIEEQKRILRKQNRVVWKVRENAWKLDTFTKWRRLCCSSRDVQVKSSSPVGKSTRQGNYPRLHDDENEEDAVLLEEDDNGTIAVHQQHQEDPGTVSTKDTTATSTSKEIMNSHNYPAASSGGVSSCEETTSMTSEKYYTSSKLQPARTRPNAAFVLQTLAAARRKVKGSKCPSLILRALRQAHAQAGQEVVFVLRVISLRVSLLLPFRLVAFEHFVLGFVPDFTTSSTSMLLNAGAVLFFRVDFRHS